MAEVETRGLSFHVQRMGAGDRTVVFLHGLVMDNLSSWYFTVANRAAESADVVLYDLRGHGKTSRPKTGYSIAEMVADLDALLDGLGVDDGKVDLVGNSFGGLLAVAYAAAHPDRVSGLALVDGQVHDAAWGAQMKATLGLRGRDAEVEIARSFKHWLGRHSERKRNRLAANARALVLETSLVEDIANSPPTSDDDLRRIICPVLALYGEHSDVLHHGERLAEVLPDCRMKVYPGCTHSILWEKTTELRDDLLEWIRR